jgi:NADPH:quinone reductase-like Zn-dependent oxidoreductase
MEPNRVELVDIPMPVTGEYDALVRVRACGICSSTDLKIVHYEHPEMPGFPFKFPAILGHEGAGEIVSVGSKVRHLHVGDRVVSPRAMGIPECGYSKSYGGMVEYGVVPDIRAITEYNVVSPFGRSPISMDPLDFLSKVFPNDISFVDAAMMLTFKENYSALKNFGIKEGMDILIFGDGSISMV